MVNVNLTTPKLKYFILCKEKNYGISKVTFKLRQENDVFVKY